MKIDKLRIKVLAVAFVLLATAGLGECFAQPGNGLKTIRENHVVKVDGRYVMLDVNLNYSDAYSPNLQRSLSQMVFGVGNDSFAAGYKAYLGRYGELQGMDNKSKTYGIKYRCHLEVLDYKPGRYAVFHSFSDSTMVEKRADKMLIAMFGYEIVTAVSPSKKMQLFLKTTNERYMIYDLSKDRPLTPADVFPPERLRKLGVDTLSGYVSVGAHEGELKLGNQHRFASYAFADWKSEFTEYFKQLIGFSDGKKVTSAAVGNTEEKLFDVCEQMPQFPGGDAALFEYLADNIEYPAECEANGTQGRVLLTFIVETDGSITNVNVVKSVHPLLDDEAVGVIKSMPKWIPGKQNGKAVRVKYTVPVSFRSMSKKTRKQKSKDVSVNKGKGVSHTASGAMSIQNYHMVNENGWNVLYQVDLLYPGNCSPELQRCLSRMVFGIESDSVQGAYNMWLGQKKQLKDFSKALGDMDFKYRRLLRMLDNKAGRYAVFSSVADSDYMEYTTEQMPQKRYGYSLNYKAYSIDGRMDHVSYYKVQRTKTNERAVIFDFRQNKPLGASDVFTPEGIKKFGIDTLGTDVNLMLHDGRILFGNANGCQVARLAVVEDYLTDYFKELAAVGSNESSTMAKGLNDGDKVYEDSVDQMPEFPGGKDAMFKWVAENLKYPEKLEAEGYQGRVIVAFVVEPDGSLSSVRVEKSVHPLFDIEASRLVMNMPKWRPGKKDGKPVRVKSTLPVTFRLQ